MARTLKFKLPDQDKFIETSIDKVSREKLYGSVDVEAFDEDGNKCELLSLAGDGKTIFGYGSVANVIVDVDGDIVEKSVLTPVTSAGETIEPHESSFSVDIELSEKATVEDYLSHIVKSVYELNCSDPDAHKSLVDLLKDGAIYKFYFSYRSGIIRDTAFLISSSEDIPFMILGIPANIDYLNFKDASALDADIDEDESDSDLLDFDTL